MVSGLLLLNKPRGITSHDLVDEVRKIFNQQRVGHTGILDPSATGLMVILLGKGTLFSPHLTGSDKRYSAVLAFGRSTDTFDSEGEILSEKDPGNLSQEDFCEAYAGFIGKINQLVPPYSAMKLQGKRMYKAAREGEILPTKYKEIEIYDIDILSFDWPEVTIHIRCSAGTYVRSLAHEIGQKLGCGGYLKSLVRTGIGHFKLKNALGLDELQRALESDQKADVVRPLAEALPDKPQLVIRAEYYRSILEGKPLIKRYLEHTDYKGPGGCLSLLMGPDGKVLAVAKLNYNWGSFNRLETRDILGKYVRIIDEGHLRN
jgi:tRNA pseudouridine55 synthase